MKTLFKKLETIFAAAAFAEEGEAETARQILKEKAELRKTDRTSVHARPTLRAN